MEKEGHSEERESPSEKSFTITWRIEDSKYFFQAGEKLQSPVVFVDVMEQTGWRLVLSRLQPCCWIYVTVKREAEDHGPEQFDLHYDFEMTPEQEGALKNKRCSHVFRKNESGPPTLLYKGDRTTGRLQSNNFTIRCIMRKNNGPISMSGHCIALTRIGGEDFEFVGKVENFSALPNGAKKTLKVISSSEDEKLMTVDLRLEAGLISSILVIDITPVVKKSGYRYHFSCTVLECSGHKTGPQFVCEYTLEKAETLRWYRSKEDFDRFADFYLSHDTLKILCVITLLTGIKSEELEQIEYETTSVKDGNKNLCSRNFETSIPARDNSKTFPSILDDFIAFYRKGILCDTKLQTATETFPAHKNILSARSPVFEAMFTSNMKEKIEECVRIDDVDAETVKRMLLFLYSDSLEELEWSDAKKLYFAADKYQVLSLKHRCAGILKKNIDLSNCCELLILADLHRDEDLKAAVQNFVTSRVQEVFLSDQWRNMERSHPQLAIDIFRAVHIKDTRF